MSDDTKIDDMRISVRAKNALTNGLRADWSAGHHRWMRHIGGGIYRDLTVADICEHSARDLLKWKNIGRTTLAEIVADLASRGLALKGDAVPIVPSSVDKRIAAAVAAEREANIAIIRSLSDPSTDYEGWEEAIAAAEEKIRARKA